MNHREYNKLVEAHADGLFRFAMSMCKDQEVSKDVVQEAFARLWERKDAVELKKSKSYLFTTVHHAVIDHFRRQKRYGDEPGEAFQPQVHQHQHDLQEVLHQALDQLPEIQKSVVLLRDYEGYSYQEIAEITQLNESQVKVYIFRARKRLQAYIGKMEVVI